MPPADLLPFAHCRECDAVVEYEIGDHEGARAHQRAVCRPCGALMFVFYDDGENVLCAACGKVVPFLVFNAMQIGQVDRRLQRVTCPECNSSIADFHPVRSTGRSSKTLSKRKNSVRQ